jgi:hypothetical protein
MNFRWTLTLSAALTVLHFLTPSAYAQTTPAFIIGERAAEAAARKIESECSDPDEPSTRKRKPGWKTALALGKDDWSFVINSEKLACIRAAVCGTGGCQLEVVTVISGQAKSVFKEQTRAWKIIKLTNATPYIRLDQHGGACGKAGVSACPQKLDLKTGEQTRL